MEIPTPPKPYWKDALRLFLNIIVGGLSVGLTFGLVMALLAGMANLGSNEGGYTTVFGDMEKTEKRILSIPIQGVILGQTTGDGLSNLLSGESGVTYGYSIKEQLYEAASDDSIKAVILEIDSPGGTIYGAQAIADGVEYYRSQTKKPVYAQVSGVAASGAYWAGVSADKFYSDYGSTIGSIGVISGPFQYYDKPIAEDGGLFIGGVVTQNGIESQYITAGKSKDLGSPYRRLTSEEQAVLQQGVNNEYNGFVRYVANRRSITEEAIKNQIGALIYDPLAATNLKLVDGVKNRDDAYRSLAEQAGVADGFQVVRSDSSQSVIASVWSSLGQKIGWQAKSSTESLATLRCGLTRNSSLVYYGSLANLCQ